jgi:hypothetical protein
MNIIKSTPLAADKLPNKVLWNPRFVIAKTIEPVNNSKALLSGEAATGKSKLVHNITIFTPFCKGKSEVYFGAVIKTVPTECAAYNIRGYIWHSAHRITPLVEQKRSLLVVDRTTN